MRLGVLAVLVGLTIALPGCTAPEMALAGAVAGAASASFKLDDDLLIYYEKVKGNTVTITPTVPQP